MFAPPVDAGSGNAGPGSLVGTSHWRPMTAPTPADAPSSNARRVNARRGVIRIVGVPSETSRRGPSRAIQEWPESRVIVACRADGVNGSTTLPAHGDGDDHGRPALVRVEHIGSHVQPFEGRPDEQTALDVTVGLVDTRPLGDEPTTEPLDGRERELGPVVQEAVGHFAGVPDVLAFAVEFDLPPAQ